MRTTPAAHPTDSRVGERPVEPTPSMALASGPNPEPGLAELEMSNPRSVESGDGEQRAWLFVLGVVEDGKVRSAWAP